MYRHFGDPHAKLVLTLSFRSPRAAARACRRLLHACKAVPHRGRAADKADDLKRDHAFLKLVVGGLFDVERGEVCEFIALQFAVKHIGLAFLHVAERRKTARAYERNTVDSTRISAHDDLVCALFVRPLDLCKLFEGEFVEDKGCVALDLFVAAVVENNVVERVFVDRGDRL